ncbi:hypothetical protein BD309DRAFT_990455 [Dichomitus squalens]|uniref:Uncharacterized protein n=2 Tax=Dichomitus squalens TaxID=114155 RepID=A0A4V6MWW0_9APHY|nr:uncharacterized protein DICSQDRAFT_137414 [Dichomitus squalens LYAD-421 SS1]EJF60600.1 hypothetical protein DICSQDRAFT_137414 [Dichomitus squalens LYAD-421 SS1]TBU30075.1 hypothetical protein BD311DRAFT_659581 [Dichomitus squalens]TBU44209.1 hypothetical protein BD309DRAFT_990455 [Dichomitus squalens]TBU61498.1 hypothetical protein BD310DRAFT_812944 [Dichomitus squalens]
MVESHGRSLLGDKLSRQLQINKGLRSEPSYPLHGGPAYVPSRSQLDSEAVVCLPPLRHMRQMPPGLG